MDNTDQEPLSLYVVYDRPTDFPDGVVIRRWEMDQPKEIVAVCADLEEARDCLESFGLINVGRKPGDEKQIVEVWL